MSKFYIAESSSASSCSPFFRAQITEPTSLPHDDGDNAPPETNHHQNVNNEASTNLLTIKRPTHGRSWSADSADRTSTVLSDNSLFKKQEVRRETIPKQSLLSAQLRKLSELSLDSTSIAGKRYPGVTNSRPSLTQTTLEPTALLKRTDNFPKQLNNQQRLQPQPTTTTTSSATTTTTLRTAAPSEPSAQQNGAAALPQRPPNRLANHPLNRTVQRVPATNNQAATTSKTANNNDNSAQTQPPTIPVRYKTTATTTNLAQAAAATTATGRPPPPPPPPPPAPVELLSESLRKQLQIEKHVPVLPLGNKETKEYYEPGMFSFRSSVVWW